MSTTHPASSKDTDYDHTHVTPSFLSRVGGFFRENVPVPSHQQQWGDLATVLTSLEIDGPSPIHHTANHDASVAASPPYSTGNTTALGYGFASGPCPLSRGDISSTASTPAPGTLFSGVLRRPAPLSTLVPVVDDSASPRHGHEASPTASAASLSQYGASPAPRSPSSRPGGPTVVPSPPAAVAAPVASSAQLPSTDPAPLFSHGSSGINPPAPEGAPPSVAHPWASQSSPLFSRLHFAHDYEAALASSAAPPSVSIPAPAPFEPAAALPSSPICVNASAPPVAAGLTAPPPTFPYAAAPPYMPASPFGGLGMFAQPSLPLSPFTSAYAAPPPALSLPHIHQFGAPSAPVAPSSSQSQQQPHPLFPNASVQFLASPRTIGHNNASFMVLSKNDRGNDASSRRKIFEKSTACTDSSLKFRRPDLPRLLSPHDGSSKLADYMVYFEHVITVLDNWCTQFDISPVIMGSPQVDVASRQIFSPLVNVLWNHSKFTLVQACMWQSFINRWFPQADFESSAWLHTKIFNMLDRDLLPIIMQGINGLDSSFQGGFTTAWFLLDQLILDSHEIRVALQNIILHFDIRRYDAENVSKAIVHIKSVTKFLSYLGDVPPHAVRYLLSGMARSSNDKFNRFCEMKAVLFADQLAQQTFSQHRVSDVAAYQVIALLGVLESQYRMAVSDNSWQPQTHLNSTGLHLTTQSLPASSGHTTHDLAALLSASTQQRQKKCFRCGATDHLVGACPKPDTRSEEEKRRSLSRGRGRVRSLSRDRPSRDHSRGRSRDRQPVDNARGRPRSSTPGPSKSVNFSADVYNLMTQPTRSDEYAAPSPSATIDPELSTKALHFLASLQPGNE